MDKNQQQLLLIILMLGLLYSIYISVYGKSRNVEGLQNNEKKWAWTLDKSKMKNSTQVSYAALSPPQKKDLSPQTMMSGEIYRYIQDGEVSYDVYAYLHLINGAVFEKKVEQKYKIYVGDKNAQMIVNEELFRDGDDVYKLKLRNIPKSDAHRFNEVIVTFVDEKNDESIILHGSFM